MTRRKPLGIGALSKQSGCNIETIRYYERIGLMAAPGRTAGGHRVYDDDLAKRLFFILRSRQLGFSINEIRTLLHMVDGDDMSCVEVMSVTEEHLADVQRKIKDLRKLERVLKDMVAQCSGTEVPECPIIDCLNSAA